MSLDDSARKRMMWASLGVDVLALVVAYVAADALRSLLISAAGAGQAGISLDITMALLALVVVSVFGLAGLYELEAYVSRPIHLWLLLKASGVAFVVAALMVWAIKAEDFSQSRFVLFGAFILFVVLVCAVRLVLLDRLYVGAMQARRPACVLLGDSSVAGSLFDRLSGLRGFDNVTQSSPEALRLGWGRALEVALDERAPGSGRAVAVFVDATTASPRDVYDAVSEGLARGADVFVVSRLLGRLECNSVLSTLFDAPVTRVRGGVEGAKPYALKRAFDVVGSSILLLVCSPILAVLGAIIRSTSEGPVFYTQTRLGRSSRRFEFLKLRSMVCNNDASRHAEYVKAFMKGAADATTTEDGDAVFKLVDDPRITPIGRFIRKYSLDELPQFINVLRGDMGLVGPRPPLPYEVAEYDEWHLKRMSVPMGVTGLWQVAGRSRVSFDEMILQDLMYGQNMRLLLDVKLCLGTIPAMLMGSGGG